MSAAAKKKKRSGSGVAWTVVAVIAVLAVGVTVGLFVLGKGGAPNASPTPTPSASTPSVTPTPTPTVDPTDVRNQVTVAVQGGDSSMLVAYMADPVKLVRFGSDAPTASWKPAQLADFLADSVANEGWDVVDENLLAQWQDSPWAEYFPADALVLVSDQDHFMSIIFDANDKISKVIFGTGASLG